MHAVGHALRERRGLEADSIVLNFGVMGFAQLGLIAVTGGRGLPVIFIITMLATVSRARYT